MNKHLHRIVCTQKSVRNAVVILEWVAYVTACALLIAFFGFSAAIYKAGVVVLLCIASVRFFLVTMKFMNEKLVIDRKNLTSVNLFGRKISFPIEKIVDARIISGRGRKSVILKIEDFTIPGVGYRKMAAIGIGYYEQNYDAFVRWTKKHFEGACNELDIEKLLKERSDGNQT